MKMQQLTFKVVALCVFTTFFLHPTAHGQLVLDKWENINEGFAKCANIGESSGNASISRDDFEVEQLIDKRGEMYAYMSYGNEGVNKASCSAGLFRYDSIRNQWIKVANPFPTGYGTDKLLTNHTDIFSLSHGRVYMLTEDYTNHPTGWKKISKAPHDPLTGLHVFTKSSCSPFNAHEAYQFTHKEIQAIGDTIYVWGPSDCQEENVVLKFSVLSGTWTWDVIGPLPHQAEGETNVSGQHYDLVFTSRIAGYFQYFVKYTWRGGTKCYPDYLYTWDPRVKKWQKISKGVRWDNQTGTSNPQPLDEEGKICPLHRTGKRVNKWGPAGGLYVSWDRRQLFAASEKGIWRWAGDKWYWIGDNRENTVLYPTEVALFTRGRDRGIEKLRRTNYSLVGDGSLPVGKGNSYKLLESPDNGRSLYVAFECGSCSSPTGIYKLRFDPDKPERVRNLHIETGTYLGGPGGDNTPVNAGIGANYLLFVAGNFASIESNGLPYKKATMNGASDSDRGKLVAYKTFGDSIISVLTLGKKVYDYEIQNYGEYRMAISGDWGVTVVDSTGHKVIWSKTQAELTADGLYGKDTDVIILDIDDLGNVVVERGNTNSGTRNGSVFRPNAGFIVYDANGNRKSTNTMVRSGKGIYDITISNDTVYAAYQNQANFKIDPTAAMPTCKDAGGYKGQPIQQPVLRAYANDGTSNPYRTIWKTWDFPEDELYHDMADAMPRKVNVGKDGKVYFLGEAAGGNSVYRWNGKETNSKNFREKGTCKSDNKLVTFDTYNLPINTSSAHIGYFCTIDPSTGEVERGQYIIPRLSSGKSNSHPMKNGYVTADGDGYVYIAATSAATLAGREIQHVNGQLVGDYVGGDMDVIIISPDYRQRTFWGTFSKEKGSGDMTGIAVRDNLITVVGKVKRGKMITGATKVYGAGECQKDFQKEYAIAHEPFNLDMDNTIDDNDGYLAIWYQDVWNHGPCDSLEERKIVSNPVIPEDEFNYKPDFKANSKVACVNKPITIYNASVGDSINHTWDFGKDADLLPGTAGVGPWRVTYSSPGLKTLRLEVMLKHGGSDYEEKHNYINVLSDTLKLQKLTGPSAICEGGEAVFDVKREYDVEYVWEVPDDAIVVDGQGGNVVRIVFGRKSGMVRVKGKYACGETNYIEQYVSVMPTQANAVMLVVGDTMLSSGDRAIKAKMEGLGYNVVLMDDDLANATHAGCADMIYISSTVDHNTLGFAFRKATNPVIVAKPEVMFDMGMVNGGSNDYGRETSDKVALSNASHAMIGATMTDGVKQVYSAAATVGWGAPASNSIQFATIDGDLAKVSLFVYETGANMQGLTAPGKRVAYFMSDAGAANATADNDKLLERVLCWSMGNCPVPQKITTTSVKPESICPGQDIKVDYTVNRKFGDLPTGPVVPVITIDNPDLPYTESGYKHWDRGNSSRGTNATGYYGSDYRHDKNSNKGSRFAFYTPSIPYPGEYEVLFNFPTASNHATNTLVKVYHEGGVKELRINQRTGGNFQSLGVYRFKADGTDKVEIRNDGTDGYVVTDAMRFVPRKIDPVIRKNKFIVQLSNQYGVFTNPTVLGALESDTSGSITGKVPFNLPLSSQYRIRVVGTMPSVIGTDNGKDLTIGSLPVQPTKIIGNRFACRGVTVLDFEAAAVPGITQYYWHTPLGTKIKGAPENSVNKLQTGAKVTIDFGTATTNEIKVYSVNQCGRSEQPARHTVSMTGLAPSAPEEVSGDTLVCVSGQSVYSIKDAVMATSYVWEVPKGATIVSGDSTTSITVKFDGMADKTTDTIKVSSLGACGLSDTTSGIIIRVDNKAASPKLDAITGEMQICPGQKGLLYEVAPLPYVTYTWTVPAGAKMVGDKNKVTVDYATATGGKITVAAKNQCGTGDPSELPLTFKPTTNEAVLVVGNKASLTSGETVIKSELERANYTVVISQNSEDVVDLGCKKLIFISASVSRVGIPEIYRDLGVPVIVNKPELWGYMGISSTLDGRRFRYSNSNKIYINSALSNHPVAKDIGTNWQTIFTSSEGVGNLNYDRVASGVAAIAKTGNRTNSSLCLMAFDDGVDMVGMKAPARRVGFFLDADGASKLNAKGIKLLQNTICWAGGLCNSESIETSPLSVTSVCPKGGLDVPFTIKGFYNSNNVFTAQLSDANGDFTSPTVIGTLSSASQGTIKAKIPEVLPIGTQYRIRVISSSPQIEGTDNGTDLDVKALPTKPSAISGMQQVCSGIAISFKVDTVKGIKDYVWKYANSWGTGTAAGDSIRFTLPNSAATDVISVSGKNACGEGDTVSMAVTVNHLPEKIVLSGADTLCDLAKGDTIKATIGGYTSSLGWVLPSGVKHKAITDGIIIDLEGSAYPGFEIKVVPQGICGNGDTTRKTIVVNKKPGKPTFAKDTLPICEGVSKNIAVTAPTSHVSAYTWSLPVGFGGTSTTTSIDISAVDGKGNGLLKVVAQNQCGAGAEASMRLLAMEKPSKPLEIVSKSVICQGEKELVAYVKPGAGADEHKWTYPMNWGTAMAQGEDTLRIMLSASAKAGVLSVEAKNGCGFSDTIAKSISIQSLPEKPNITAPDTLCYLESGVTVKGAMGAFTDSLVWSVPSSVDFAPTTDGISITLKDGAYPKFTLVAAPKGVCGNGDTVMKEIIVLKKPKDPTFAESTAKFCEGDGKVIKVQNPEAGVGYNWSMPVGFSGNSTTAELLLTPTSAVGGALKVNATNRCGASAEAKMALSTDAKPSKAVIIQPTKDTTICLSGTRLRAMAPSIGQGKWISITRGPSIANNGDPNTFVSNMGSDGHDYRFLWIVSNGSCKADSAEVTVSKARRHSGGDIVTGAQSTCEDNIRLVATQPQGGQVYSYQWGRLNGADTAYFNQGTAVTASISDTGRHHFVFRVISQCGVEIKSVGINKLGCQLNAGIMADKNKSCVDNAVFQFSDASTGTGLSKWEWKFSDGASPSSSTKQNPGVVRFNSAGKKNILLTLEGQLGRTDTAQHVVMVEPALVAVALPDDKTEVCIGTSVPIVATGNAGIKGTWSSLDGGLIQQNDGKSASLSGSEEKTYRFVYKEENSCGQVMDTISMSFVNCSLSPSFDIDKEEVCEDTESIRFMNTTTGGVSYEWDFGKGASPATFKGEQPPAVKYMSVGEKTVALMVKGRIQTLSVSKKVMVWQKPERVDVGEPLEECSGRVLLPSVKGQVKIGEGSWVPISEGTSATETNGRTYAMVLETGEAWVAWKTVNGVCPPVYDSLSVTNLDCPEIFVPNAFEPSATGENAHWEIPTIRDYYPNAFIKVYNRWGGLVFSSEGYPEAWDGTNNGAVLPFGTYYYVISDDSLIEPLTGTVTILK